jgi:putative ABC transport system permease protein
MRALDRKLLRDLRSLWSQVLTIALVVASGMGGFIACLSAVDSLALARDDFYAEGRFADVFASLKRAPLALQERLAALPGVAQVDTRVEQLVRLELPGVVDPVLGQLIGLEARKPARLNRVFVKTGRLPSADASGSPLIEVALSAAFAEARGLAPGARLSALVNGRRRELLVVGTALSPEFIFAGLGGMPDMRGFGIVWMDHELLASAYDMRGAFNRVALKLAPGAEPAVAMAALQPVLAPYGGREAYGREDQSSHAMLSNEIKEQRVLGTVAPVIFLAVAAFLLNVVVSRLVTTQREQVAALKALGYPNRSIAAHYLKLVLVIMLLGLALGVLLGDQLGSLLTGLYVEFFKFRHFEHVLDPRLVLWSGGFSLLMAVLGTLNAIAATVRLAPAEAMRPAAPGRYRPSIVERLPWLRAGVSLRMILRQMERRPWRSLLSIVGVAVAVGIVVLGNFFRDAIDFIVDSQFNASMRSDVIVWMSEAGPDSARLELQRLPGVLAVESGRDVAVRWVHGARSERGVLQGLAATPQAHRIVDVDGRASLPSASGLVMTDRLADKLGLRPGDPVQVELLEGRPRRLALPLETTAREMMGLNAYIERRALNHLLDEGDVSSQFALIVERGREAETLQALRAMPRVVGAFSKATVLRNMQDVSARNVRIMSTILTAFASVIAVGVVYNNARIALAERAWELASLRVLGFTRAEVSGLLLGEMALSMALALPLGMGLGWLLTHGLVEALKNDQFLFPVVIQPRTYALACLAVLLAGAASALVVRRRIDRLDMVAALKTRE